jgi:hypothetical protein
MFRDADVAALARIQAEAPGLISALRWRRPHLNDVFLWVNAEQASANTACTAPPAHTRAGAEASSGAA